MIIFRYLAKEVYATLIGISLILVAVVMSNQLVQYLEAAAQGQFSGQTVILLLILQMPLILGLLLPLGLFLGVLLVYSRLSLDHEMTILSACGISKVKLIRMTLEISLPVIALVAILVMIIGPKLAWYQTHVLAEAASSDVAVKNILPGRFQSFSNNKWVVYAKDLSRDRRKAYNIFVAQKPSNSGEAWGVISAKSGYQKWDPKTGDEFIVLNNGYRYTGIPGHKDYEIVKYDDYGLRLRPGPLDVKKQEKYMSTAQLWHISRNNPQGAAELAWRLSMPVSVLFLVLLAIPLSVTNPRYGKYSHLLPAVLIYIIYANMMFVGRVWIQRRLVPSELGLWWIHIIMFLLAAILLVKYIGWRRVLRGGKG